MFVATDDGLRRGARSLTPEPVAVSDHRHGEAEAWASGHEAAHAWAADSSTSPIRTSLLLTLSMASFT